MDKHEKHMDIFPSPCSFTLDLNALGNYFSETRPFSTDNMLLFL